MKVYLSKLRIRTYGPTVFFPIKELIENVVKESSVKVGLAWISVKGATPALVITNEDVANELGRCLKYLIPLSGWRHGNAYAHLRSTVLSTSKVVPVINGRLDLPEDYEIYLLENRSVYNHIREVEVQIHGE